MYKRVTRKMLLDRLMRNMLSKNAKWRDVREVYKMVQRLEQKERQA